MTTARTKAVALALAILMVGGAGVAGADYGSSPAIDNSTTDDTTSQSEVVAGTTLGANNTFNASASKNSTFQWVAATNNTSIEVTRDGSDLVHYENSSPSTVTWNNTDSDGHFNATMDHDSLASVEHSINSNVTMNATFINDTENDTLTKGYIDFYVEWNNETTVQNIDDTDVDDEDIVTVTNDTGPFGSTAAFLGETTADVETDDRSVNGSETDVIIALSNQSALDMFDEAASDASSEDKLSSLFSSERTVALVSDSDGNTVPVAVYNKEAPDSVDEETDTYAVYKDVGGTQSLVVNLGTDHFEDADEVSVRTIGSAGATTFADDYILSGITGAGSSIINMSALLGMVPLFAGRRRRDGIYADDGTEAPTGPQAPSGPATPGTDTDQQRQEA